MAKSCCAGDSKSYSRNPNKMIYQATNTIIQQINTLLQAANISACNNLAIQDAEGVVMSKDLGGQYKYVGLTDTEDTSVYFRFANASQDLEQSGLGSCNDSYTVSVPILAVITSPKIQTYTDSDIADLLMWHLSQFNPIEIDGIDNIQIGLTSYSCDFATIYQDETFKIPTTRNAVLGRVAFTLSYLITSCKSIKPTC